MGSASHRKDSGGDVANPRRSQFPTALLQIHAQMEIGTPGESFDWSVIQSFDAFYLPNSPPWLFALAIFFLPSLCIIDIVELCSGLICSSPDFQSMLHSCGYYRSVQ